MKLSTITPIGGMGANYLKIAFRKLWRNKTHTAINLVGLSFAFGSAILLFLTVAFELSFDNFHKDAERIYRIHWNRVDQEGKTHLGSSMPYPLAPALKTEFPEIEAITRISWGSGGVVYQNKTFDKMIRSVDADFLKVFSFQLLKGDLNTALSDKNNVVITQNMATDVFGKEEPIGKQIMLQIAGKKKPFIVTGVTEDFPKNSTVEYDALIRTENAPGYEETKDRWNFQNHEVYLKLTANSNQATFEKKLGPFVDKNFSVDMEEMKKRGMPKNSMNRYISLQIMPFSEVHFDTENGGGISKTYVYVLMCIASFIVLIAAINFINLSIAQAFKRAREVGVRKSLGANKEQLFFQNWGEAFIICLFSLLIGLVLANLFLPQFNQIFRESLEFKNLFILRNVLIGFAIFLLITFIAGGYPALVTSRFNIVEVLKGNFTKNKPNIFRNSLIIVQFTISCVLISCTLIIFQQVKFLKSKPLGYDKEQIISIPMGNNLDKKYTIQKMRNELRGYSSIVAVTGSGVNIGKGLDGSSSRSTTGFEYYPNPNETKTGKDVRADWLRVDFDFLKTMGIKLQQGRDFDPQFGTDSSSIVITESMAKQMGETHPLEKTILPDSSLGRLKIIGVIPDFHLYSLHQKNSSVMLQMLPKDWINYVFVRVQPQNLSASMDLIKKTWKTVAPNVEFQGSFLDENINRWYKGEERLSQIFSVAAGIAILLSCLGLFAVALIVVEQRTKEIGVRKVLGASVINIVKIISSDFLKMVLVAFLIATPIAYYSMNNWLKDFPYHTALYWWIFALAGFISILIAILTVSYQAIKAALMNPVKSLKTE